MQTNVPQYTLRNIPEPVDKYLREQAKKRGRSLNQVIIDELSERAGLTRDGKKKSVLELLDWFIGNNTLDNTTLRALEDEDKKQKALVAQEQKKIDELGL